MVVDDFDQDNAATVAETGNTGVGVNLDHDLPEVGAPGRYNVVVFGVNGFYIGDFHELTVFLKGGLGRFSMAEQR